MLLFSAVSFIKPCEIDLGEKASISRVRKIKTTAGNINKFRWNLDSSRKSKKGKKRKKGTVSRLGSQMAKFQNCFSGIL